MPTLPPLNNITADILREHRDHEAGVVTAIRPLVQGTNPARRTPNELTLTYFLVEANERLASIDMNLNMAARYPTNTGFLTVLWIQIKQLELVTEQLVGQALRVTMDHARRDQEEDPRG